ncbi:MAG: transposase [Pseudomonadota bacterium]
MARLARIVVPGAPHHVTQRGNRRQQTFFEDADYALYKQLLAEFCAEEKVAVWAYCLMPNHVHLILVPKRTESLARAVGETHRRYSRHINFREGWRGFLWQGRFASAPMDEPHLISAARYVELNPVRARLVKTPEAWRWSSAAAHLAGRDDGLVSVAPLLEIVGGRGQWRKQLAHGLATEEVEAIRSAERTGRPLASPSFVKAIERRLGRPIAKRKPGPKPRG